MKIEWDKAPEGATHFDPVDQNWLMQFLNVSFNWIASEGWATKGWQYPNDLSTMPRLVRRPAWTGEGLPPVGTVCEYFSALGEWKVCRIVAHDGIYAVFNCLNEYGAHIADGFRPILTSEQIEAEEREAGITEVREVAGSLNTYPFANLWDAGYRKQVTP